MSETAAPAPAGRDVAKILVLSIGAVLTVAIVAIVVWSTSSRSGRVDVRGTVTFVDVINDREIAATVQLEKAPLASAECDVSAFDAKGVSVGRTTGVTFGPNTENRRITTTGVAILTPLGRAASAQVATCRITRTR